VVSATRFKDSVDALAINASVITADEIARSTARTLPELLRSRAGLFARDLYGNNAALASVDLRGFGATANENTLILIDGRRITDVDISGVQWSAVPLAMIERIEILRGSGAVQYGDGASAGVINIVTRYPGGAERRAIGSLRLGSWDTVDLTTSLQASGPSVGLNAFAQNYQARGYRDNNRIRQSNLALTGTWSGNAMDATVRIAADRQGIRLPGARQVQPSAGVDQLSFDRRGTSTPLDYAQRDGNQVTLDLQGPLGGGDLIVGLGYRDKSQRSYFDFGGFPDYRDISLDVFSLQPRYRWRADALGVRHSIVIGADFARWAYRLLRSNAVANIAKPFNTVSANQDNSAVYALDTIKLTDKVTLSAGARHEWQRLSATDIFDATAPGGAFGSGAPAGTDTPSASAAELGVRFQMTPRSALIARAARSFRFANVDEIYETTAAFVQQFQFLRPQQANTYEAGIAFGEAQPWLRAAVFRMDVRDEIHLDPFSSGVGNRNLPPLRRTGLELEMRRDVLPNLDLAAAYTYTNARFRAGVLPGSAFSQQNVVLTGRTVPLVARHKLNFSADWRISPQTSLRVQAHYVGSQFMDNDEGNNLGRQIPAYTVADLKLTHRVGKLNVSAAIDNVFNRKYYSYAVRSQFVADRFNAYPLPERSFWLTLEYRVF
jgi:iron complex outermembrane receptor protein